MIGKTCLLSVFATNEFTFEHIPTIFENKQHVINHEGKRWQLDLWDTAGQENFDRLRPLSYKEVDAYLVCFSVVDETSFDNITFKWMPELMNHKKEDEKYILVGTKSDMRDPGGPLKGITTQQINELKEEHNFFAYVETSALKRKNTSEPFFQAIKACSGGNAAGGQKGCCSIL